MQFLSLTTEYEDAMENWKTAMQRGMVSGAMSSLLSTVALAVLGKREANSHFAPTNAISHWIWGEKAARRNTPSVRYTLPGYAIHHASATFWSVLFERTCGHLLDARDTGKTLAAATAASAVACFVDYQLTPERLKPGYEKRLSRPALAVVYGAFALGLAGGAMLCRRNPSLR
ncbi:hypothetical protein NX774_20225 [Massilia agilis]|uniref:Uncharacterized protein n=1 Tax=Massilia agilis TaxID=1811226 RepID=A0ABT2DFZ7_9BURK|nr:hypothetical protein [Massilia agilis]MCS0810256.1 hypothetical protein [Massilia agilis]